jgi:hypothetical protein
LASVYWGLAEAVAGNGDWVSLAYFSGTSLRTPAFGLLNGEGVRFLSLAETLSGLGTIALLISHLPALYGAYSRREARLLTLDDPMGGRPTPLRGRTNARTRARQSRFTSRLGRAQRYSSKPGHASTICCCRAFDSGR